MMEELRESIKNRPYLKRMSGQTISSFYQAWTVYKGKMESVGIKPDLVNCIKPEVFTQLCQYYRCEQHQEAKLERKLKQRHLEFTQSERVRVERDILTFQFQDDQNFGKAIITAIEKIERFSQEAVFTSLEEK